MPVQDRSASPRHLLLHAARRSTLPAEAELRRLARSSTGWMAAESCDRMELARLAERLEQEMPGGLQVAAHFIPRASTEMGTNWDEGFLAALRFARAMLPAMAPRGCILFVQDDAAMPLTATSLRIFSRHAGTACALGRVRLSACARSRAAAAIAGMLDPATDTELPPAIASLLALRA